ncbi:nuclear telomere cap complex subunit Ten1 [Schizosaccharomyces japonicus yFS275]|uniref:Nuclear telomere cap complex subunit Ten1 n=1 Tax=Schizosaccharomyces japonicus (strain yFS275 / FY16936) TaxID=402676 RepID=B6K6B7_SCHJY|nr:nuclear telomere cap complex subunit Ten1 [Schizosaccharomyces japonicus yFS275]EEB09071.1 nuclear telomere cap complex subunit Ten1 [Schizosaccharomyces japonicus yFS275]
MDSAKLIFAEQLAGCSTGDKVRFLACVEEYKDGIVVVRDGGHRIKCDVSAVLPQIRVYRHEWVHCVGRKRADDSVDVLLFQSAVGMDLARYREMVVRRQAQDAFRP